jgi:DNA polymerase III sliding clamp (beta) subunit (PCNA family)
MKIAATAAALRGVLVAPRSVCAPSATQLAHTGVQLRADGTTLTASGTDGDVAVQSRTIVHVDEPGEAIVAPRPLLSILDGVAPAAEVTLSAADGTLTVSCAGASPYRLRLITVTYPPSVGPSTPPLPANLSGLGRAVTAVRAATSLAYHGVQVVSSSSGLQLAATDQYRLHVATMRDGSFGEFSGLIPLSVLDHVVRAHPSKVAADSDSNVVGFAGDRTSVAARLLSGTFPSIDTILATTDTDVRLQVNASDLRAALTRLEAIGGSAPISVSVGDDGLKLAAADAEIGDGCEDVRLVSGGGETRVGFAADRSFLADAVAAHGDAVIDLWWRGPHHPVRFHSSDPEMTIATVVMPVRF